MQALALGELTFSSKASKSVGVFCISVSEQVVLGGEGGGGSQRDDFIWGRQGEPFIVCDICAEASVMCRSGGGEMRISKEYCRWREWLSKGPEVRKSL